AHCFGKSAESGAGRVWSGLPETCEPHEHQVGVDGMEFVGADSPALQRSRAEVLDYDIGGLHHAQEDFRSFQLAEVEANGPLVAADLFPPEGDAGLLAPMPPHAVAVHRMLDLDHVSTEVAQNLTAQ